MKISTSYFKFYEYLKWSLTCTFFMKPRRKTSLGLYQPAWLLKTRRNLVTNTANLTECKISIIEKENYYLSPLSSFQGWNRMLYSKTRPPQHPRYPYVPNALHRHGPKLMPNFNMPNSGFNGRHRNMNPLVNWIIAYGSTPPRQWVKCLHRNKANNKKSRSRKRVWFSSKCALCPCLLCQNCKWKKLFFIGKFWEFYL